MVAKVQAYLNVLSAGGAGAGWNTWRMKLPPSILVQMAKIIARASGSGADDSLGGGGGGGGAADVPSEAPSSDRPGLVEDLLSSQELIEKFELQSLLDGGGGGGGPAAGSHKERQAQLLAATLHPDDGKRLRLAAQGATRQPGNHPWAEL